MEDNYAASLRAFTQHPEAVIPVERIAGRLLLVCGELDEISPSCPMSRQIQERLIAHRRPEPMLLAYTDAGHRAFGVPVPPGRPRPAGDDAIAKSLDGVFADSWQQALAFLEAHLSK